MKKIAIIPARGGSKRLPRKNILPLNGKPLITYVIDASLQSRLFDHVIVSTEDDEIVQIVESHSKDVLILKRKPSLSEDSATVKDVCQDLLENLSFNVDSFCLLTATSALVSSQDLLNSYNLHCNGFESVVSVTNYFFQPHAAMFEASGSELEFFFKDYGTKRTSELPKLWVQNGALNWCNVESFLVEKTLLCGRTAGYKMKKYMSIDIDEYDDFLTMKMIYSHNFG